MLYKPWIFGALSSSVLSWTSGKVLGLFKARASVNRTKNESKQRGPKSEYALNHPRSGALFNWLLLGWNKAGGFNKMCTSVVGLGWKKKNIEEKDKIQMVVSNLTISDLSDLSCRDNLYLLATQISWVSTNQLYVCNLRNFTIIFGRFKYLTRGL